MGPGKRGGIGRIFGDNLRKRKTPIEGSAY
jgi:hypothetical protein